MAEYTVEFSDDKAVLARNDRPVLEARVLGREIKAGYETVWLDRWIGRECREVTGWQVSGAITTILYREI